MTERFWDEMAPYEGPNGYARCTGEEVVGSITQSIEFKLETSLMLSRVGVREMTDGRRYILAIRKAGHVPSHGHARVAILHRGHMTFKELAEDVYRRERGFMDPGLAKFYRQQIDAL
jgi:hypothetical protein